MGERNYMPQAIKEHFGRQKVAYGALLTVVAVMLGLWLSLFYAGNASANVTNVVGADTDTSRYGIDGDIRITWTPNSQPAGYESTHVYLASSTLMLTTSTLDTACGGSACGAVANFNQYSQSSADVFGQYDSNGQTITTTVNYIAWVYVSSTNPVLVSSSAFSVTFDSPADTEAPFVDHVPVHTANQGSFATFYAGVMDQQTTPAQFANVSTSGTIEIYYGTDISVSLASTSGNLITDNLFSFTIPTTTVSGTGHTFEYYILATDVAGNARYICGDPSASSAANCLTSPFLVNTISAGSRTVAGTITSMGAPVVGARVLAGGFGTTAATTDGSGNYTLSSLPNNSAVDIKVIAAGYCPVARFETIGSSNLTGINLSPNFGQCNFVGANGGAAFMQFSFPPPQGSNNTPLDERPRMGFSVPLNPASVNDTDASDAGSAVYLTTDDGTTKVAGTVTYCPDNSSPGCSSLFSQDQNVIMFTPASNLTANTFYTFVVNETVTTAEGQTIQGNRAGGGNQVSFSTGGGTFTSNQITSNFGQNGQFMPPFVKSVNPGPGAQRPVNTDIIVEFSDPMNSATINTTNVLLYDLTTDSAVSLTSVSLDNTLQRFVTIDPGTLTSGRRYEVRILGAAATVNGVGMRAPNEGASVAFRAEFEVGSTTDTTAPSIYAFTTAGQTISVNEPIRFGFNEPMNAGTLSNSTVSFNRGATAVAKTVTFDPSTNEVAIVPTDVLAPNTAYTISFTTSVTDLAGVALSSAQSYSYTTGGSDTNPPNMIEARCDDWTCAIRFNESMNSKTQADGATEFAKSVLNHANLTLIIGGSGDLIGSSQTFTFDSSQNMLLVKGLDLLTNVGANVVGQQFSLTVSSSAMDLSDNGINTFGSANVWQAAVESSASTRGQFGDNVMFIPPTAGGEFRAEGPGGFTAEQHAFGDADLAFPFNQMAGQDANVFQVGFKPGIQLQDNDVILVTFPNGTGIGNAAIDTFSPFYTDMNGPLSGTVTTTALTVATTTRQIMAQIGINGTVGTQDRYTLDVRNITNPPIPKGPDTGGYTVTIKVMRSGQTLVTKTSAPYYIGQAGSRSITVNVYAGSSTTPASGASGSVFLRGGGPNGPIDKGLTLTNGTISAVDGTATTSVILSGLQDGCYNFGTEPFIELNGQEFFGQFSPEPLCVDSSTPSRTKNIILSGASVSGAVTTTVMLAGIADFGGADIDIFAGGPGRFVVKKLTGVTTPAGGGYTLRLPSNGHWFVGVGPGMAKGRSDSIPTQLPGMPPPPIDVEVTGAGTGSAAVSPGFGAPSGASFNDATDTITFTFSAADKTVSGTVRDTLGNGLSGVEVFMHRNGFGAPVFTETNASGTFSLAVSDFGSYEIGTFKEGLPAKFKPIEVRTDGADAGSAPDVYYEGAQITNANPLVITMKKASYTISGKILDSSNNAIPYAPVFASNNSTGEFVGTQAGQDGSYTLFVDAGTWTVRSELPPDKTDACGVFQKSVTVTDANKASQNITPSVSTCYTLSGSVSVGSTPLTNAPLFIEEWNAATGNPVPGGMMRPASTDSTGAYSVQVAGSRTYRVGTWHQDYGEIGGTVTMLSADNTLNISQSTSSITFAFTGGTASHDAFIELKNSTDKTKRVGKQQNGLASNVVMTVEQGVTYNYFVDVFGFGDFSGSVAAGNTVTIDLSTANFLTVTGTIYDASSNPLVGAQVTFTNTSTGIMQSATTDANGQYSVQVKADANNPYEIKASLAGYVAGTTARTSTLTVSTTGYDFGGGSPDQQALTQANRIISGTLNDSNGSAVDDGYVWAENTEGVIITAPVDADGSYSLPVVDGTWTVKGAAPLHDDTEMSSNVAVSGSNVSSQAFNLSANSAKISTSTSGVVDASTGGSINDTDGTGVKVTAGAGVLQTSSGNVTMNFERTFSAPDTENAEVLGNAAFDITATGNSTIKTLSGSAGVQIDYTDVVASLPSGVTEAELQCMYYSPERGDYVPVENGCVIDATNNIASFDTDHFTEFVLAYSPQASGGSSPGGSSPSVAAGGTVSSGANPPQVPQRAVAVPQQVAAAQYAVGEATPVSVGGAAHTVTVISATASSVTVTIQSEPVTVTLDKDETKEVDTDADGVSDIAVTYNGMVDGKPSLTLANLMDTGELSNAITINAGAYKTDSRTVTITINGVSRAQTYALSNTEVFPESTSFVPLVSSTSWELTPGNGMKRVYVKFRSLEGGTTIVSDTIELTGQGYDQVVEEDAQTSCGLGIGKAYKTADSPAVYYITKECKKRPFNNPTVYFTWFTKWADVSVTAPETLNAVPNDSLGFMPWGPSYAPSYGAMVKTVNDPKVYLLLGDTRQWIVSETVFTALKYSWGWIEDVAEGLLSKYKTGSEISDTGSHPNYSIIKYKGSNKIYRLEPDPANPTSTIKRHIKGIDVFRSKKYRDDRIIEVDDSEVYPDGPDLES